MTGLFRGITPVHLLAVIALWLLLKLPLLLSGLPLMLPDLHQQLIGERLAAGFHLYEQLYDPVAPLFALLLKGMHLAFGRSITAYQILAAGLLLWQALRFNYLLNLNGAHPEKTYLPAMFYVLLGSVYIEFDTLSPALFGTTALIYALGYLTSFAKEGDNNKKLYKGGFLIGIAALCYQPLAIYLLVGVFAVLLLASNAGRSVLLMSFGFAFPYVLALIYYLYTDRLPDFAWCFHSGYFLGPPRLLLPVNDLVLLLMPVGILVLLSLLRFYTASGTSNYRIRYQQLMLLWLIISVPVFWLNETLSMRSFVVLFPALAYFGTLAVSGKDAGWFSGILGLGLLLFVVTTRIDLGQQALALEPELLVVKEERNPLVAGKTILLLGEDPSDLAQAIPVTPYLHWGLARREFGSLDSFESLYRIQEHVKKEKPAVIADHENLMPKLRYHLPLVFGKYQPVPGTAYYQLQQ